MMKPYLCGLISASIIVLTLSDATARFLSAPTVGVFVRKEKNCQIKWFDETEACDRGLLIRDGTIINTNKKLDKLPIQWKPAEMVDKIKLEVPQGKGFSET